MITRAFPCTFLCFAIFTFFLSLPALAAPKRVSPEPVQDGQTLSEYQAQQEELFDWLKDETPLFIGTEPVEVTLSSKEKKNLLEGRTRPVTGTPLKVGLVKSVPSMMSVTNLRKGQVFKNGGKVSGGQFEETDDGGFIWAVQVSSPGADAIRLQLRNVFLPDNTDLYFYSLEGEVRGPYSGVGPNGDGNFWTNSISSDTGVLALRHFGPYTEDSLHAVSLVVTDVAHIGRGKPKPAYHDFAGDQCGNNAACMVDANCGGLGPATDAANAVARMEWVKGPYVYTCTGGLIADTDPGTQRRLFLTANHCLNKNNNNLETFFNYTTSSCNGNCPGAGLVSTTGVTKLAAGRDGDFSLFELGSGSLPASAVFLGWNNDPVAFSQGTSLYRVSNPGFGPQVYSQHSVNTTSGTCSGLPRGEIIYSDDVVGATAGGSSGAPVVNTAGEIVGQLFGCCGSNCSNVCNSGANRTIDGALSFYYSSVEQFLDPNSASGGGCSENTECDDGFFCNGVESCNGGSCQSGSDPCPGQECDEGNDQCVTCTLLPQGASCSEDAECCSNKCKGPPSGRTCR